MDPAGIMDDGLKVVLVTCGSCGQKQLWDYETHYRPCSQCSSCVVLKTVSDKDLLNAKRNSQNGLAYSDYLIYKISVEELEQLKAIKRKQRMVERKAKLKQKGKKKRNSFY